MLIGKTIKGYKIKKLIGTGGFGAVYQAFQPVVHREVAVKIILPVYGNESSFARRLNWKHKLLLVCSIPTLCP